MGWVAGITPVAASIVICAIAWVSVRRSYRKAHAALAAERESLSAAE